MTRPQRFHLLNALTGGMKLMDALEKFNISYADYRRERDDEDFAIDVDTARAKHYQATKSKGVKAGGYVPGMGRPK